MLYIISYDLNAPGQNYEPLYDALRDLGARRILASQWAVDRDNTSCRQLYSHLARYVDANDKLLVTAPDNGWWASNGVAQVIRDVTR